MTWRIGALWLTAGLWACSGDDTTPSDDDGTPPPEETGDTGFQPPPDEDFTGKNGSIAVVHNLADMFYGEFYGIVATFPETDQGYLNLSWCVTGRAPCLDALPASGEVVEGLDPSFLFTTDSYEVGDITVDGSQLVHDNTVSYFEWYTGSGGSWGATGGFSLDGDLAPFTGNDVYTYVTDLEVTAPDPAEYVSVGPDDVIHFEWEPGTEGTMLIEFANTAMAIDDTGSYDLPVASLDLDDTLDVQAIVLARVNTTEVDAAGNTVQVYTRADQRFLLSYLDTTDRTELVVGEDLAEECNDADELQPLVAGDYWGDLTDASDDHNLDLYNDLTYFNTPGNDAVGRIDLLDGQKLTVRYATYFDASMYLLDADCDEDNGIIGADSEYYLDSEDFKYTADGDESVYLVLDSYFEGGWYYWLEIEID